MKSRHLVLLRLSMLWSRRTRRIAGLDIAIFLALINSSSNKIVGAKFGFQFVDSVGDVHDSVFHYCSRMVPRGGDTGGRTCMGMDGTLELKVKQGKVKLPKWPSLQSTSR